MEINGARHSWHSVRVEVDLAPSDGLLPYTGGVIEARTPNGDIFGEQGLRDLLTRGHLACDSPPR